MGKTIAGTGCRREEVVLGSDFGAPARAGDQARKIIVVEARRLGKRKYSVEAKGRNERLTRVNDPHQSWELNRRGWTAWELGESLVSDTRNLVTVTAFDFPFSIPLELLQSASFASVVGQSPFQNRASWVSFVAEKLPMAFNSTLASSALDFSPFEPWKSKTNWKKRLTDHAAGGHAPLKHKYQVLFGMTLLGAVLLSKLQANGFWVVLDPAQPRSNQRSVFETYPGKVAEVFDMRATYKSKPETCLNEAEKYLKEQGISLTVDPAVRRFCETYRTSTTDPDGADAFLCLVSAICFREGRVHACGEASSEVLVEEGCILVPRLPD
jgi:hypothetical protein